MKNTKNKMKTKLEDINERLERVNAMIALYKANPSDFMLSLLILLLEIKYYLQESKYQPSV